MAVKKYHVTVAGHICLDIIPQISDSGIREVSAFFKPGKLIQVNAARISTGGPVSNTGIALSRLGLGVAFMARVGDDDFGRWIIESLAVQGHTRGVSISKQDRTSYTIVIAPPGIDRIFFHYSGANDRFSGDDLKTDVIRQSSLFHFGYPPIMENCYQDEGQELARIMTIARQAGATTSLDMALPDPESPSGRAPWRNILKNVLPFVDIFLPSIEEIYFMLERDKYLAIKASAGSRDVIDFIQADDYRRLAEQCLSFGVKIAALKTAHRGFYIRTADLRDADMGSAPPADRHNWSNRELWCPAFQVAQIASATGSGDSSIAGFLSAYLRDYPIELTLRFANCVGFQNLHQLDAISGIRSWQETVDMVEGNRLKMIPLPLEREAFSWSSTEQLWIGGRDGQVV